MCVVIVMPLALLINEDDLTGSTSYLSKIHKSTSLNFRLLMNEDAHKTQM